ncbi:MAG: hypothetical protein O2820_02575 [Planctomycetota bacterium]|nr:hypothetical protein [Planctomycetota bacterium]
MDHIDEFESMFRKAERESFAHVEMPIESVALVTDGDVEAAEKLRGSLKKFLPMLADADNWRLITGDDYSNVSQLQQKLESEQTDLVITQRHLQENSLVPQHSLGVYLDVLTQVTSIPVLVLPGTAAHPTDISGKVVQKTMVVADHISGDSRLINYGARFCPNGGTLWLCHVEDDAVLARIADAIEKIPEIDSETGRRLLETQLLKEASDYIQTCVEELKKDRPRIACESRVVTGHFLKQYSRLIDEAGIDLLVANTKDEDQMAMHGMAYSLSVELIDTAMLLL